VPFPHKHDFYQLVFVSRGGGWHEIDFHRHKVARHSLFLIKPGQIHAWQLAANTTGYVIEFTTEALAQDFLYEWLKQSPDFFLAKPKFWAELARPCREMLAEFRGRPPYFEAFLQYELKILLVYFLRELGRAPGKTTGEIENFRELVEKYFSREHGVEFYAAKLGLSPKVLTMRVSRALKTSAREVIHARISLEAKRLLAQSEDPVAEIGYALGFDDPNYFARFFRNQAKMTPGAFRAQARRRP
jgi:AraC-like DNA-binding protein